MERKCPMKKSDKKYELIKQAYRTRRTELLEHWHELESKDIYSDKTVPAPYLGGKFDWVQISIEKDIEIIEQVLFERKILGKERTKRNP